MKKNKLTQIIAIGLISLSLLGCSGNNTITPPSDNERTTMINNGETIKLEKALLSNKSSLTQEESTKNVSYLLSSIENSSKKINKQLSAFKTDLDKISHDYTDYSSDKFIEACPTNAIKGIFKDAKENHLLISRDEQGFYTSPDYSYIKSTYGSNVDEEFKDLIAFQEEAGKDKLFDSTTQTLDFNTIAERIQTCEEKLDKYQGKDTYDKWLEFEYFYYSIILSPSDTIFFDAQTNAQTIQSPTYKESVIKQYDDLVAAKPDSQLSKDIKGYMDIIKANGKKTSAESDNYLNKVNEKFLSVSTTPISSNNSSSNSASSSSKGVGTSTKGTGTNSKGTAESPKITIVQDNSK